MPQDLNNVTLLSGSNDFEQMKLLRAYRPFAPIVCEFWNELSKALLSRPDAKQYPDVVTFGFFCRKSNLQAARDSYGEQLKFSLGRGLTFHIAPSNVPVNFAYSMICAMLAGNSCIVRVSTKDFPQVNIISAEIERLLCGDRFFELKQYVAIVRYDHDQSVNEFFSSLCDVRIVWGGDTTVAMVRSAPLPPRSFDITFADRYSVAVIYAQDYLSREDKKQIALDFYNDTYLFDQNACSSPRLIYWVGDADTIARAQSIFWQQEHSLLRERQYRLAPVTAVDKCVAEYRAALTFDQVKIPKQQDNLVSRITLASLSEELPQYTCAGGSFFEYSARDLMDLTGIITRKYQTLIYLCDSPEQISNFLFERRVSGIDRIVPCGKAAEFHLTWDGYNLIHQLSRTISVL